MVPLSTDNTMPAKRPPLDQDTHSEWSEDETREFWTPGSDASPPHEPEEVDEIPTLPPELLSLIAADLASSGLKKTLLNFILSCQGHFEAGLPELMRDVDLSQSRHIAPALGDVMKADKWRFTKSLQLVVIFDGIEAAVEILGKVAPRIEELKVLAAGQSCRQIWDKIANAPELKTLFWTTPSSAGALLSGARFAPKLENFHLNLVPIITGDPSEDLVPILSMLDTLPDSRPFSFNLSGCSGDFRIDWALHPGAARALTSLTGNPSFFTESGSLDPNNASLLPNLSRASLIVDRYDLGTAMDPLQAFPSIKHIQIKGRGFATSNTRFVPKRIHRLEMLTIVTPRMDLLEIDKPLILAWREEANIGTIVIELPESEPPEYAATEVQLREWKEAKVKEIEFWKGIAGVEVRKVGRAQYLD